MLRDESGRDENRKCFPYGRAKVVATKRADENPPVRNGLRNGLSSVHLCLFFTINAIPQKKKKYVFPPRPPIIGLAAAQQE